MKTRIIPLLLLAVVVLSAPAAMAACLRCDPVHEACKGTSIGGFLVCEYQGNKLCYTESPCGTLVASATTPLAAEFVVASVERLDAPKANTSDTPKVASLETPKPATH
jgi:hypothetical protein